MKRIKFMMLTLLMSTVFITGIRAQEKSIDSPAAIKGFRGEFLAQLTDVQKKMVDLAEAMPAEKYTWRPMDSVRSVSEVYMHIALSNFSLPTFIGVKAAEGVEREMEKKLTEKSKVIDFLSRSFRADRSS